MENYVYDKLIKEIENNGNICDELIFHRQDLEMEQCHSGSGYSIFGIRVPPRETTTFLNIFKIVSDHLQLPSSFYHNYTSRQLYRVLCLSYFLREIENYKKVVNKNFLNPKENILITDENDEFIINTAKKLKEMYQNSIVKDDNYSFENLKELTQLVLDKIDEYDNLQNVWYYDLRFRKELTNLEDDKLDKLIYTCIRTRRDPTILYADFVCYTRDLSSCVSNIIGLVYFCYELLLPYSLKMKRREKLN